MSAQESCIHRVEECKVRCVCVGGHGWSRMGLNDLEQDDSFMSL